MAERLRRLHRLGLRRGRAGLNPRPAQLDRSSLAGDGQETAAPRPNSGVGRPIEALVGGQEVWTPCGSCVIVETRYPLSASRGGWPLAAVLGLSGEAVAAAGRNDALAAFDFRQAVFLDLETSGLAGGAGTVAFLVGLGFFELSQDQAQQEQRREDGEDGGTEGEERREGEWAYVVRQVFMRHPGEEQALLQVVTQTLARCTGVVTFNGRAFDLPLLKGRYVMQAEPSPLAGLLHLDLLPVARRRWRQRLASCALTVLEQEVLAFRRSQEDVPSWLIPSLYREYVRGGDGTAMVRVFYHNREDIVSLVPLAAMLCAPFQEKGYALDGQTLHPAEYLSLGRCYEELGWLAAGEAAYRRALTRTLAPELRAQVLYRLGWLLKRQERREEATAVWQEWITSVPGADPTPYVELAKHHEWHGGDLVEARQWALWALHTARQMPPGPAREQALANLQHRLRRLERKLSAAQR